VNVLGGFGGHIDHDPHILSTLSAVQILITYDRLDAIQVDKVVDCKSKTMMMKPRVWTRDTLIRSFDRFSTLQKKTLN
jgi:hypothetical protein